ncbi:hypothetical protein R50076_17420 [Gilvimarinus japonicus]
MLVNSYRQRRISTSAKRRYAPSETPDSVSERQGDLRPATNGLKGSPSDISAGDTRYSGAQAAHPKSKASSA